MSPRGLILAGLLAAAPAQAWHDAQPATDDTASVLLDGELRLGLFKWGFGVTDWLTVETFTLPWILRAATLGGKAVIWTPGDWTVAVELGLLAWNPAVTVGADDQVDTPIVALPMALHATWQPDADWRLTGTLGFTGTKVLAEAQANGATIDGAVNTTRAAASVEWRLGRVAALVLSGHLMLHERVVAGAAATQQLDDDTTLAVYGDGSVEDAPPVRGHGTLSVLWSWSQFNLRLGGGYGHYRVPIISYFLPTPTFVPEAAAFFRF